MYTPERGSSPRARALATSGILLALGLLCGFPLLHPESSGGGWSVLFAPTLIILGTVALVRGLIGAGSALSGRSLLWTGLAMLLGGACPWVYTGLLIGGSPGNEGAGMLGTLIFLFVGVPGLLVTIAGLSVLAREWMG
jgi:hypothetical protein